MPDATTLGEVSTGSALLTHTTRSRSRWLVGVWTVVVVFAGVTVLWSLHVGVPLRDPDGRMFRGRLTTSLVSFTALVLAQAAYRSLRSHRSLRGLPGALRAHWPWERVFLAVTGLLAYHVVYVCYRNLKSWNAFRTLRDDPLMELDRWLFLGHTPAVLLHDLLGQGAAAYVLAFVYRSFTYLVPFSVIASLVFVERIRDAYVFVTSAMWVWILGVASYYLLPSLGPFAAAAPDYIGLPHTAITDSQSDYLLQRARILTDPGAGDAFASLGAFASLHVAFTCMVVLMLRHYRAPRPLLVVGTTYLVTVMVATVYFGWHFVLDDLAGVLIALLAVALGRALVLPRGREPVDDA